jgi:hypothetical protein
LHRTDINSETPQRARRALRGHRLGIAALLCALALASCGDEDDPAAVAREWRATAWQCGKDVIRRAYGLERRVPGEPSLDERLRQPQRSGCSGGPVPKIDVAVRERRGDRAVVSLSHSDEPESYEDPETIVLVREDDGWKVDRSQSDR